jgi:hypothetical protein
MSEPAPVQAGEVVLMPCRNEGCPHGRPPVEAYVLYGNTFPNYCGDCARAMRVEEEARARREAVEELVGRSGVTPLLRGWSLASSPAGASVGVARSWLEGWVAGGRSNLVLFGPVGTGKTGLAWGIVRELIERHLVPARFANWRDLLSEMQRSFDAHGSRLTTTHLQTAPVVCLDDLGAEQQTDWRRDELATLIERRHQHRLATIFTTNYDLKQLARRLGHDDLVVGKRLVSRINEGAVRHEVTGPDRRAGTSGGERSL